MTVVSAMRHVNPRAVTLVFSGYPEMQAALAAILLQADEILVKPLQIPALIDLIHKKLSTRHPEDHTLPQSVATILERDSEIIIQRWVMRVGKNHELNKIVITLGERTGHLAQLIHDLVVRLRQPHSLEGISTPSLAAVEHGRLRYQQKYTAALMIEESRMLQVSIFETLQNNLASVDFSLLLADVMTIADEVDSQLAQAVRGYMSADLGAQQKQA
jgi:YesN/AraC family two-component response regulator